MSTDSSFVDEVVDRLQLTGPASARRMFGGYGIFQNDLMFALIADNELYLKADKLSSHFFTDNDLPAFTYSKANGKEYKMSYFQAPESFFEDNDETVLWANRALDAALRAPRKPKKKSSS